jgi:hypothetical protein
MHENIVDSRDLETDAQLYVLVEEEDDGKSFDDYCVEHKLSEPAVLGLAATLLPYLIANDVYRVKFNARVSEIATEKGIAIKEGDITPGCKCDYCEYARLVGHVKGPEATQKVFIPNLEHDALMAAVAIEGDDDELETVTKSLGLTVDEGIIRGKRLAVYLLDNPEYQAALDKRVEEIQAERKETNQDAGKKEAVRKLGLEPTPELIEFIDALTEDASKGGPLSKPYVDAGAIVVHNKTIDLPAGIGEFTVNGVALSKTRFKEVYLGGSSQMNS